jgi:hypothetical protein
MSTSISANGSVCGCKRSISDAVSNMFEPIDADQAAVFQNVAEIDFEVSQADWSVEAR